jgi:hypothetical protein
MLGGLRARSRTKSWSREVLRMFSPSPFFCHTNDGLLVRKKKGKMPMDSTPSRPQDNTDQRSAESKALEEALSKLVEEGTTRASERRAQMAGSDAVWEEPSLHATFPSADLNDDQFLGDSPSPGRRFSRALTRFLIMAFIVVGCTLAWRAYGEAAQQKLATFAPQLRWVLSLVGLKPSPTAELIAERPRAPTVQESEPDLPQPAPAAQTAPDVSAPPTPTVSSSEVQQAPEVMARDLADPRQTKNQLVVGQEQMAREIATLRAAEKDLRPRISAPKPAAVPARSRAPKPPPQATPQIITVPPPPAPSSVQPASPAPVRTGFTFQDAMDDAWREWSRSRARPSE